MDLTNMELDDILEDIVPFIESSDSSSLDSADDSRDGVMASRYSWISNAWNAPSEQHNEMDDVFAGIDSP